ncbi:MAG TPA: T9SS type A sorting domain-containing protein [Bacteroidales bacterium]|nr:T9SS type A sorting domain-containing protein [Bacteroidales bacterium]
MKLLNTIRIVLFLMIVMISSKGFTQRLSGVPSMGPKQQILYVSKTPNDTLLPGNLPYLVTPEYVLLPSTNGGYVLGTNGWNDKCKCQQFKVSYYYHIEGAIYWFGYKKADSAGLVRFAIWNMDSVRGTTYNYADSAIHTGQNCPGTIILAVTDTTTNIDTSSSYSQAHIVMFPFPVLVTSDYCIGFDMSKTGADSIALMSTNKGQGGKLQLVWEQWSSNNKWYTLQGAQWDGDTLDIDAMIFPIIDNTVGCIENGEFISGVKLSQSYPNPVAGQCTITYELADPQSSVTLRILNIQGKQVYFSKEPEKSRGIHQVTVDVSNLADGTYFYVLSTDGAHIAKKMCVNK